MDFVEYFVCVEKGIVGKATVLDVRSCCWNNILAALGPLFSVQLLVLAALGLLLVTIRATLWGCWLFGVARRLFWNAIGFLWCIIGSLRIGHSTSLSWVYRASVLSPRCPGPWHKTVAIIVKHWIYHSGSFASVKQSVWALFQFT